MFDDFAGRRLQHVFGVFRGLADRVGPDEEYVGGGDRAQSMAMRLSAYLPPGSWQLVTGTVMRSEVSSWYLALFGWAGVLLAGAQMIKLIIKGIEVIYGDGRSHSFFGRQLCGLLLFIMTSLVWLTAIALSVFGGILARVGAKRTGRRPVRTRILDGYSFDSGNDCGDFCAGHNLQICPARRGKLGIGLAGRSRSGGSVVGAQLDIWDLCSKNAIRARVRRPGRGDRPDGMDGNFRDSCLSGRVVERGKTLGKPPNPCPTAFAKRRRLEIQRGTISRRPLSKL